MFTKSIIAVACAALSVAGIASMPASAENGYVRIGEYCYVFGPNGEVISRVYCPREVGED
jgi:hypothetical protein